ncbi:MAG: helix-turn-helix transcriptional regulator [Ignavibacteriae bacterium]|nr:helix-turn-helix transcriptional regulator [Ignavibacteriota bacterium]
MAENIIYKIIESIPVFRKRFHRLSHDLAGYLYHVLNDRGIKQNEFAEKMKKSESEISKWLSGYHNFTIKTIAKIESELGIELIQVPFYENMENEKIDYKYYIESNTELKLPTKYYLSIFKPDFSTNLNNKTSKDSTNLIFSESVYNKAVNF